MINGKQSAVIAVFGDVERDQIIVTAKTGNDFDMGTFRLPRNIKAGNYDLIRSSCSALYRPNTTWAPSPVLSGNIVVIKNDTTKKVLTCKFNFQSNNMDRITDGEFSLIYVK